jgi:hypothetical protein
MEARPVTEITLNNADFVNFAGIPTASRYPCLQACE